MPYTYSNPERQAGNHLTGQLKIVHNVKFAERYIELNNQKEQKCASAQWVIESTTAQIDFEPKRLKEQKCAVAI